MLQRAAWAHLRLLVPEGSAGRGSLPTCARPHGHSVEPGAIASDGLTQCCQGWSAPDCNDTFSPSRPCNYCCMWGWMRCQRKCFPYVSFFKKGKKKSQVGASRRSEPATRASASRKGSGAGGGLPCALAVGASGGASTPKIYVMPRTQAELEVARTRPAVTAHRGALRLKVRRIRAA